MNDIHYVFMITDEKGFNHIYCLIHRVYHLGKKTLISFYRSRKERNASIHSSSLKAYQCQFQQIVYIG